MALEPGIRFGSYEIGDAIGAGGMGEVYRAHDTTLERDVAIKVLPASFADDAARVERFDREAKTLAALNHPNIAQIYGLERSDSMTALVMELVEGLTLADRIAEGPLPADEALGIAMQIADALEAAHSQNIVHRDLKPANVKIRPDGLLKVLDFGIAKALAPENLVSGPQSPIMTTPATQVGVILGTAAYMSPEQAKGKAVDQRTDIWAFGCVLYEMLTGQLAFGAEDVPTTLARVIANDTDLDSLPAEVSPAVRHTIKLCLQKDIRKRVADIRDVKLALAGAFLPDVSHAPKNAAVARPAWRRGLPIGLTAILSGALGALWVWSLTPAPEPQRTSRFPLKLEQGQLFTEDENSVVDISHDGRQIVYAADNRLWLHDLNEMSPHPVEGIAPEERPTYPTFSPDGQSLLYFSDRDLRLRRVFVVGGTAIPLTESLGDDPQGLYWNDDDRIYYVGADRNIMRVAANGGMPEVVIEAAEGEDLDGPRVLPGDEWLLFTVTTSSGIARWDDGQIVAQSLQTGERRLLWQGGSDARYVPTGHLMYALGENLFVLPFDVETLTVTGRPTPVATGVQRSFDSATDSATANYAFSDDGSLVYVPGTTTDLRTLVWMDRDGREQPVAVMPGLYSVVRIGPNGRRVAIDAGGDIFVWDLVDETLTRLTFDAQDERFPVWTPDAQRIAYIRDLGIYWNASNGTGTAESIAEDLSGGVAGVVPFFFRDETRLISRASTPPNGSRLLSTLVDGTAASEVLLSSPLSLGNAVLSPDGRWMAYELHGSGQVEVYVGPFPDLDADRWQVSNGGGGYPVWSPTTNELFYMENTARNALIAVEYSAEPTFSLGQRRQLTTLQPYLCCPGVRPFDIAPDGERFLMVARGNNPDAERTTPQVNVVLNWFEELARLVPTN